MKTLKLARTLAASVSALAVGALLAGPAMAFDVVDWNWKDTVVETQAFNTTVNVDVKATGLVQIEKLQLFFGDVTATAETSWVTNEQFDPNGYWRDVYSCYCYGKLWVPNALNAVTELPEVKTAASAFGNLQVITSDVPIFLQDAQFVSKDGGNSDVGYSNFSTLLALAGVLPNTNLNTDLAKAFIIGAIYNVLAPSQIEATAHTSHIINATVDSSATAAANLIQVNLESDVAGGPCTTQCGPQLSNHVIEADIAQFADANVKALSTVQGVHVDNYSNLGVITRPLVNNVSTAIGNGVIVNVGPVPTPVGP